MRLIVAGSRHMSWLDAPLIDLAILKYNLKPTEIVCGMAKGADTLGRMWAEFHGVPIRCFPAQWDLHGKAAGSIRNIEMGKYADALLAFIWNNSRGTAHMISYMKKLEKPHFVVENGQL